MYVLPKAGKIAHDRLAEQLANFGYLQSRHTPGIWHNATCDIRLCLVVDNFGVKYINTADSKHLNSALARLYKITSDWSDKLYLVLNLK